MDKALLVIDIPKNCKECTILCNASYDKMCKEDEFIGQTRPDVCPLIPFPKKKTEITYLNRIDEHGCLETNGEKINEFNIGWNACITEITDNSTLTSYKCNINKIQYIDEFCKKLKDEILKHPHDLLAEIKSPDGTYSSRPLLDVETVLKIIRNTLGKETN